MGPGAPKAAGGGGGGAQVDEGKNVAPGFFDSGGVWHGPRFHGGRGQPSGGNNGERGKGDHPQPFSAPWSEGGLLTSFVFLAGAQWEGASPPRDHIMFSSPMARRFSCFVFVTFTDAGAC